MTARQPLFIYAFFFWGILLYRTELEVAEQLPNIIPALEDGKYLALAPNNHLYQKKVDKDWLHMTKYEISYDNQIFELKCAVIEDGKYGIEELPYSVKLKRQAG
ncbi:MAG: hypothetical protein IJ816_02215 [Alloprevotella sp.]|nr:hypothetical protein [Alloprevotella sp.]